MDVRSFQPEDAKALASLSALCARGEGDFVLNPLWESEAELFAEFARRGIDPVAHLVVADGGLGVPLGLAGFLREPGAAEAGLVCPVVRREERGQGIGGELLRGAIALGKELGIELATAALGTRNRAGYSLMTSHGFRPKSQVYVMRCDARPIVAAPLNDSLEAQTADADDADEILDVYATCDFPARSPDQMRSRMADGRHLHLVARDPNGHVVAFVELQTHWPTRPWVGFVGVRPDLRDRGLGSLMVGTALQRSFDGGAGSALLALAPGNRTAVRAYEKVGFRRWRLLDVLEREI